MTMLFKVRCLFHRFFFGAEPFAFTSPQRVRVIADYIWGFPKMAVSQNECFCIGKAYKNG